MIKKKHTHTHNTFHALFVDAHFLSLKVIKFHNCGKVHDFVFFLLLLMLPL